MTSCGAVQISSNARAHGFASLINVRVGKPKNGEAFFKSFFFEKYLARIGSTFDNWGDILAILVTKALK